MCVEESQAGTSTKCGPSSLTPHGSPGISAVISASEEWEAPGFHQEGACCPDPQQLALASLRPLAAKQGPDIFAEESVEFNGSQEPRSQGRWAKDSSPWQATAGAPPKLNAGLFPAAKPSYANRS